MLAGLVVLWAQPGCGPVPKAVFSVTAPPQPDDPNVSYLRGVEKTWFLSDTELMTVHRDKWVRVWDVVDGSMKKQVRLPEGCDTNCVPLFGEPQRLMALAYDKSLRKKVAIVLDLDSGEHRVVAHLDPALYHLAACASAPYVALLADFTGRRTDTDVMRVLVYNTETWQEHARFEVPAGNGSPQQLAFSPDGRFLAVTTPSGITSAFETFRPPGGTSGRLWSAPLFLFDVAHRRRLWTTFTVSGGVCLSFSLDGRRLHAAGFGTLVEHDTETAEIVAEREVHYTRYLHRIPFKINWYHAIPTPDGRYLFGASAGTGYVWSWRLPQAEDYVRRTCFPDEAPGVTCMALSPDGRLLATGSLRGPVKIWAVDDLVK